MTGLASASTNPVTVTSAKSGTGYYYPLPVSSSLGTDVAAADSNRLASNIITLSISSIPYAVTDGQLVIDNSSSLESKSFTIVGQGESSSVINAEATSRVFEIVGTSWGCRWYCRAWRSSGVARPMAASWAAPRRWAAAC